MSGRRRTCLVLWAVAAFALLAPVLIAQEDSGNRPLEFRRIFVPADRVDEWPTGNTRYLPIDAAQFERLLSSAQAHGEGRPSVERARISKAEYQAKLVEDELLVGQAQLEIVHHGGEAQFLPLDPLNLPLASVAWSDKKTLATAGVGPDGRFGVLVEVSGKLLLEWSLRGERNSAGAITFGMALPPSPINRLAIETTTRLSLSSDDGLIATTNGGTKTTRRWQVDLGGKSRLTLRAVADDSAAKGRQLTLLRQSLTYDFSPRGVDVVAQLRMDVHGEPISRITVQLDPGLKLVGARYGDAAIPWSSVNPSRVTLELPEPLTGAGRMLRLSAIAPLKADGRWKLPGIRTEGMFWQEGTATLIISQPLVLQQIATKGCRQSKATPLAAPAVGESIDLQYFAADAAIDVIVGRPRERFRVDSGVQLQFKPGEVTAETVAELSLRQAEQYVVRADIGASWLVDSVETGRAADLADWSVEAAESNSQRLVMRLARAVTAKNPLRLAISSHRTLETGQQLNLADAQPLVFLNATTGRQLIAAQAVEPYELKTAGAEELTLLSTDQLSAAESQSFATPAEGVIFAADPAASRLQLGLVSRKPHYNAELRVDATVQSGALSEVCSIQCLPMGTRVDRVLVQFAPAQALERQWSLLGASPDQISARRLADDDPRASAGVEVWEVQFRSARSEPFTLRAERTSPVAAQQTISLCSLPDAAVQHGVALVHSAGATGVEVKSRRLKPMTLEPGPAGQRTITRAAYRYDPARDAASSEPILTISSSAASGENLEGWAWSGRLESRFAQQGTAVHRATYRVQVPAREQLCLKLPAGAQLRSLALDGATVPASAIRTQNDQLCIDLPPSRVFVTLAVAFNTPESMSGLLASIVPAMPELDVPVLAGEWTIWLPSGYALQDSQPRWRSSVPAGLTWSQRLFGPLGRGPDGFSLNPLDPNSWPAWLTSSQAPSAARSAAAEFIEALGAAITSPRASEGGVPWSQLLAGAKPALDKAEVTLLFDLGGLDQIGFSSRSTTSRSAGTTKYERGVSLLKQAGLVLIANQSALVVTSGPAAAPVQSQLTGSQRGVLCEALPGELAAELDRAVQLGESTNYLVFDAWQAAPDRGTKPWAPAAPTDDMLLDTRGWQAYTTSLSDATSGIHVVRTAGMHSLAWVVFFAVLAAGIWMGDDRHARWIVFAGALAVLCLLAPAAYTPLLSAALLATLGGLGLRFMARPPAKPPQQESQMASTSLAPALQAIVLVPLVVSLVACAAGDGLAQQKADKPPAAKTSPPAPPTIHKVLVPMDDEQQPTGGNYYVPEALFNELYRRAGAGDHPTPWLLRRATYHGKLARDTVERNVTVGAFKASYDLQVFEPDVRIRIPLTREGISIPEGGAKLDGRAVDLQWDAGASALVLAVAQPGEYRLELAIVPTVQAFGAGIGFDIAVPSIANSSLTLELSPDLTNVEVLTARGQLTYGKTKELMSADLGPIGRLSVRWPAASSADGGTANLSVDELLWVKVQPGSLIVESRFKYRVIEGRVRQVRLLVDPRLRLLPAEGADPLVASIRVSPGTPDTIDLEFSRPVSDQATVDLKFLLTGSSGVGNLRLPRLEASGPRSSKRWLAVSVDPALEYSEKASDGLKPLSVPDFVQLWGASDAKPQVTYTLPRGEPNWVLSTRPREAATAVTQSLSVNVGRGSTAVVFDATLATSSGSNFQVQLAAPPALEVDTVSVLEEGVQRASRWSQDDAGLVTVFYTGPVSGRQQLSLRGRLRTPERGQLSLATIQVLNTELEQHLFHVYRQPSVLVEVGHVAGMKALGTPAGDGNRPASGSVVQSYEVDGERGAATLIIAPNPAQSQGVQVTTLELAGGVWTAQVDYDLHVTKGVVDALRFEIPPQWTEPFQLDRQATVEVVVPAPGRRQLVVRPPAPITDDYRITIEGRIAVAAGQRVRAPDVLPLEVSQLSRFVVLPVQVELQQTIWDVVGLKISPLPAEFRQLPFSPESFTAYRVAGQRFQADLRPLDRTALVARVTLADIRLAWQLDGRTVGVAAFDLEPAGAATCTLQLPSGDRLIHVDVEGVPAMLTPAGQNRWRIHLTSRNLPQRIEATFVAPPHGNREGVQRRFDGPTLADLEIDRVLWTIFAPPQAGQGEPAGGRGAITRGRQELLRLKSTAELVDDAAAAAREIGPEELARWYPAWDHRVLASRDSLHWQGQLTNQRAKDRTSAPSDLENEAKAVIQSHGLVAKRVASHTAGLNVRRDQADDAPADLLTGLHLGEPATLCMFRSAVRPLQIDYPQLVSGDLSERVVWAVLLAALTVALVVSLHGREAPQYAPATIGLAAGLVLWLATGASGLGFLLLAACGFVRVREYFRAATPSVILLD